MSIYHVRGSNDQKKSLSISGFESILKLIDQDLSSSARYESRDYQAENIVQQVEGDDGDGWTCEYVRLHRELYSKTRKDATFQDGEHIGQGSYEVDIPRS